VKISRHCLHLGCEFSSREELYDVVNGSFGHELELLMHVEYVVVVVVVVSISSITTVLPAL